MSRNPKLLSLQLAIIAAAMLGISGYLIARTNQPAQLLDPRMAPMAQPDMFEGRTLINALGVTEPSSQLIWVGTEMSGTVTDVFFKPGDVVKRGDRLFTLDSRVAHASLNQRKQDLSAAEARLAYARAKAATLASRIEAAKSAVIAAEAERDDSKDLMRIGAELKDSGSIANRDITRRKNAMRIAEARVAEAYARLNEAQAEFTLYDEARGGAAIAVEAMNTEQMRAAVGMAQTNLALRTVLAPADATVLQVNIRPGEFAQAGMLSTPLMALGHLEPLHVRVELDETDIARFASDMSAVASPRGNTDKQYTLRFVRIEPMVTPKRLLTGAATERVDTRVMQVLYEIDGGKSHNLLTGQQLDVFLVSDAGHESAQAHGLASMK